jgi:transcriptional regulator with XRE-family HTH domain
MRDKVTLRKTDPEIMGEIGTRLRALRGERDILGVAGEAGLDRGTVSKAEKGANPTLRTIVRLLRVYGRLGALDAFIPEPQISPMSLLTRSGKRRGRRAPEPPPHG